MPLSFLSIRATFICFVYKCRSAKGAFYEKHNHAGADP
jgi:hypothetical protein